MFSDYTVKTQIADSQFIILWYTVKTYGGGTS